MGSREAGTGLDFGAQPTTLSPSGRVKLLTSDCLVFDEQTKKRPMILSSLIPPLVRNMNGHYYYWMMIDRS